MNKAATTLFILIFLSGCAGTIETKTEYIDNKTGGITHVVTQETNPQIEYQKTMQIVFGMMKEYNALPLEIIEFNTQSEVAGMVMILPKIIKRQPIDWESVISLIRRTPTTGENWKNGLVEGLQNLGIPLAIAGMATVAVQSNRTLEETRPSNTAGGDITQSERSSGDVFNDRSNRPVEITEDSHNTENSHNTTTTTTEIKE